MGKRNTSPAHFHPLCGMDANVQLQSLIEGWVAGNVVNLFIVGPKGTFKTTMLRHATKNEPCAWVENATGLVAYDMAREAQEQGKSLIVFDDSDGVYDTPAGMRFMKALTNKLKPTVVPWSSRAVAKEHRSFESFLRVCAIDNAWNSVNDRMVALVDRGRPVLYSPPPLLVHRLMEKEAWFTTRPGSQEVQEFVYDHLFWIKPAHDPYTGKPTGNLGLSVRTYENALEDMGIPTVDWRQALLRRYIENFNYVVYLVLEADPAWNLPVAAKQKEWCRRTGKCRDTYYETKKNLKLELLRDNQKGEAPDDLLYRLGFLP